MREEGLKADSLSPSPSKFPYDLWFCEVVSACVGTVPGWEPGTREGRSFIVEQGATVNGSGIMNKGRPTKQGGIAAFGYVTEREGGTLCVDGTDHTVPGRETCRCAGNGIWEEEDRDCPHCGGYLHEEYVYGGYFHICEHCLRTC